MPVGSRLRGRTGQLHPRVKTLGTEEVGVVTINDRVVPKIDIIIVIIQLTCIILYMYI